MEPLIILFAILFFGFVFILFYGLLYRTSRFCAVMIILLFMGVFKSHAQVDYFSDEGKATYNHYWMFDYVLVQVVSDNEMVEDTTNISGEITIMQHRIEVMLDDYWTTEDNTLIPERVLSYGIEKVRRRGKNCVYSVEDDSYFIEEEGTLSQMMVMPNGDVVIYFFKLKKRT